MSEMGLYCIMILILQVRDGAAGLCSPGTVTAGETGPECLHRGRGPQLWAEGSGAPDISGNLLLKTGAKQ